MKLFLSILILIVSLQSWTKADDIRDFQIEGISIGDSALDFISKDNLLKHKKDWFKGDEFSISADLNLNFLKIYDALQIIYRTDDKKFKIEGIEAIKFHKDIENCHVIFDEVVLDIKKMFKSIEVTSKVTSRHEGDKVGKTMVTYQSITMPNNDGVSISCYDWSKESGYWDQLRISIRTFEYDNFLLTAY